MFKYIEQANGSIPPGTRYFSVHSVQLVSGANTISQPTDDGVIYAELK
jgi:hypothetical protein